MRGGNKFVVFKSMNPPKSLSNWANLHIENEKMKPDVYTSKTTYLQSPPEWLGEQFINDAEWLKQVSPEIYKHEYLGVPIGNGTEVFDNLVNTKLDDEFISHFDSIFMGIDWGWYPDPFHWTKCYYDMARRDLYIYDEYRCTETTNKDTAKYLQNVKGVTPRDLITCDSAEPKSVSDYRAFGINARPAVKGPDSIRYGIKWLASLNRIIIDSVRCPKTWEEFSKYEYVLDKDGNPTSTPSPYNNHSIDAVRYAMERLSSRKGK